jgi:TPR repeat protein
MRKLTFIFIGIIIFSGATFSVANGDQEMKLISGAASFYLSDSDLELAKKNALEGDAKSSYQIYQHYYIGKGDIVSAFPWLHIAANNGYVDAQYSIGYVYTNVDLLKNIQLGKYWLEEAERNGSARAKELLEEIKESETSHN